MSPPAPAAPEDRELVEQLLLPLGSVEPIHAERLMDVVTAVSGSGPAYVFILAEVLAAAAEQEGLDKDVAMRLASRTVAGAGALMLETGETPNVLRKQVTSPGGTTEAALDVLSAADGLGPLLRRAVSAAAQRSRDLGKSQAFRQRRDGSKTRAERIEIGHRFFTEGEHAERRVGEGFSLRGWPHLREIHRRVDEERFSALVRYRALADLLRLRACCAACGRD